MNYAMSSVYYGYDYRKKYDKQITEKGEITTVHALSDSATILNFLAVAALSGIIGGISYDAVKKIFRQILNLAKNCKENIGQDKIEFYVDNDIDIFIQMIKEFHFDFEGVSPAVKSEIIKEMIIWELTDSVFSIKKNGQISKEEIFEKLKQVIERVEHTKTLSKQDFIDFWDKVKEND